jgi:peroxiredoxin
MTGKTKSRQRVAAKLAAQRQAEQQRRRKNRMLLTVVAVVVVLVAVAGLYAVFRSSSGGGGVAGTTPRGDYQVGQPGPGKKAPDFTLASSNGGNVTLSALRGKTVLLYFQEGLTCQPCWDQITDLEKSAAKVKAAGIDQVISITTNPVNLIAQKTRDMKLTTPVLSDPNLAVSKAYHATDFHMSMMSNVDGHSFLLIGPDQVIKWRADYGGPPKETMYLPVPRLLADIKAGNR